MKRDHLLLTAFFPSGAAALGYEILWTRLLSLVRARAPRRPAQLDRSS